VLFIVVTGVGFFPEGDNVKMLFRKPRPFRKDLAKLGVVHTISSSNVHDADHIAREALKVEV
jgi:hypothetical protein